MARKRGQGWHGEPSRHADAARGIETKQRQQPITALKQDWDYVSAKMDRLMRYAATSPWTSETLVARYERDIEDILTNLENNMSPSILQIKTRYARSTIGEELELSREAYEASFTYNTLNRRFIALEAARERLHSIISRLPL